MLSRRAHEAKGEEAMIHSRRNSPIFLVFGVLGLVLASAACERTAAPPAATPSPVPPKAATLTPHSLTVWVSVNAGGHATACPDPAHLSVANSDYLEWQWDPNSPVKPAGEPKIAILDQPGPKCQGKPVPTQRLYVDCSQGKHCKTTPAVKQNYGCYTYEITVKLTDDSKVKTDPEIEVDN
jgi:hypothetical protein